MKSTHSVWIGPKLGLMEKLTLTLLVNHGHDVTLWTQGKVEGVPKGVEVKPLPKDVIPPIPFTGIPHPYIPNGGIGHLAAWSDYFAFETLFKHGGTFVQMDVAVCAALPDQPFTFTPWLTQISPCVMNVPKCSQYARSLADQIAEMITKRMDSLDWHETMHAMFRTLQGMGIAYNVYGNYFDCGGIQVSPYTHAIKADVIHWSNATHNTSKEKPTKGSEYERLCKECGLI
jgi:hypothetical protein